MESIVEDDSYVGYIQGSSGDGCMRDCEVYQACKVVVIPYTIYKSAGSGWIFPKNSPLLPIFSHYVTSLMKEGGMYTRISKTIEIFSYMRRRQGKLRGNSRGMMYGSSSNRNLVAGNMKGRSNDMKDEDVIYSFISLNCCLVIKI